MALYYNFTGGQQYELADTRAELENRLQAVPLRLGETDFVPGQEIAFGHFIRPLLYVGAEASSHTSYTMYFYSGNTGEDAQGRPKQNTLFDGESTGKAVYLVLHWINETCYIVMSGEHQGRDYKFIRGTWDWERGPGTEMGGRHVWQREEARQKQPADQYPPAWQSPELAPAGGELLPAPVATEPVADFAFAQAQRLRILKLKKQRQKPETGNQPAAPEPKPDIPGKTEGWSTGGRLGSHYFLVTGNNTGVALCNKSLKPPFLYGLNINAPDDACQRCLNALKKRGLAKHEVIQPEHLQIGRVLRVRDLEKLRGNFWFKKIPADHAGLFVVGSVPIPTRITPTSGSRFKWYLLAGKGLAHMCSLSVIRQFFELATDYAGPTMEVWMARIADDDSSSGSDTRHVALPAGLSPPQAEEAAKAELGVSQVMKITRAIGQAKPNATS